MVRLSRLETKTQEVTLLMTVVATLSVVMGGFFYLTLSGADLQMITGQWGARLLLLLFDVLGLSMFLLALLFFWLGRFVLLYTTEFKEIVRLYPRLLFQVFLYGWLVSAVASYLTIGQIHWDLGSPSPLRFGLGGHLGQFLGGNFYDLFGLFGSLILVTCLLVIVGIVSGHIQLVSFLLYLEDLIIGGLQWSGHQLAQVTQKALYRLRQDWALARLRTPSGRFVGLWGHPLPSPAHTGVSAAFGQGQPQHDASAARSATNIGGVSRPHDLPPPPSAMPTFVAPDFVRQHVATKEAPLVFEQAQKEQAQKPEAPSTAKTKGKVARAKVAKDKPVEQQIESSEDGEAQHEGAQAPTSAPPPLVEIQPWKGRYQVPDAALLKRPTKMQVPSESEIRAHCLELEERLASFQIKGKVMNAHVGASLTMYEFQPEPGVKVSKIMSLSDDLALMLGATTVRILAPIPGKKTIGIEVPNGDGQAVMFASLLPVLQKEAKQAELPIALGVDVHNQVMVADLTAMPHLLVAGTTGSGKSVFMNSLIMSLLYTCSPKHLRFLMIDPKMIELSPYNGIPHLLKPVVTDVNEAKDLLVWAEQEMDRRYQMFSDVQARNITSFNEKIAGSTKSQSERRAGQKFAWEWQEMPYIVIVIDELADLMLTQGREVEIPITRIAQKARAAGIHLVIATQRPSSDIVTGLIKTNFPTRLAFKVASAIDSRTILDDSGAEKLLGRGDMLFLPNGKSVQRIQGCFLGENEVKKVVQVLNTAARPG